MAETQILRVTNTNDDANGGGEILEYVSTTDGKQKGTTWGAADHLVFPPFRVYNHYFSYANYALERFCIEQSILGNTAAVQIFC